MTSLLSGLPLLFAEGETPAPAAGAGGVADFLPMMPLLLVGIMFFFLIIRPQMQQEKQRQGMLKGMKKNDRVLTSAGMYGTVVSIDEAGDKIVLRVGEDDKGVKIAFTRASITKVIVPTAEKAAAAG